jgi:hypothetical protein
MDVRKKTIDLIKKIWWCKCQEKLTKGNYSINASSYQKVYSKFYWWNNNWIIKEYIIELM